MKPVLTVATLALVASSLGACATVTRTPNTAWAINTVPGGARVTTSNGYSCDMTPCTLTMPRRSTFTATISHPGYKPVAMQVSHRVSTQGGAAFLGNALIGGVIGATLDVATGSTFDLYPNPGVITLERDVDAAEAGPGFAPIPTAGPGSRSEFDDATYTSPATTRSATYLPGN